jgi:hypothetical protein
MSPTGPPFSARRAKTFEAFCRSIFKQKLNGRRPWQRKGKGFDRSQVDFEFISEIERQRMAKQAKGKAKEGKAISVCPIRFLK